MSSSQSIVVQTFLLINQNFIPPVILLHCGPPRKPTWHWKIRVLNRKYIFNLVDFPLSSWFLEWVFHLISLRFRFFFGGTPFFMPTAKARNSFHFIARHRSWGPVTNDLLDPKNPNGPNGISRYSYHPTLFYGQYSNQNSHPVAAFFLGNPTNTWCVHGFCDEISYTSLNHTFTLWNSCGNFYVTTTAKIPSISNKSFGIFLFDEWTVPKPPDLQIKFAFSNQAIAEAHSTFGIDLPVEGTKKTMEQKLCKVVVKLYDVWRFMETRKNADVFSLTSNFPANSKNSSQTVKKKVASADWFPFLQTNSPWPEPSTHRHQVHEFQRSHIGRHWCSWRPRLSHVRWNPSGCSSFIYPRHLVKVLLKKIRCQITSNQHIPIFCWQKFQKYQDHPFMVKDFFPWNPWPEKYPSNQNRPPFDLLKFDPTTSTGLLRWNSHR